MRSRVSRQTAEQNMSEIRSHLRLLWARPVFALKMSSLSRSQLVAVDVVIDSYPTRRFYTEGEIRALDIPALKAELSGLGIPSAIAPVHDKHALEEALLARRPKDCAVCLEEFQQGEALLQTLCGHGFHEACMRRAAVAEYARARMLTCPKCRSVLPFAPPRRENSHPACSAYGIPAGTSMRWDTRVRNAGTRSRSRRRESHRLSGPNERAARRPSRSRSSSRSERAAHPPARWRSSGSQEAVHIVAEAAEVSFVAPVSVRAGQAASRGERHGRLAARAWQAYEDLRRGPVAIADNVLALALAEATKQWDLQADATAETLAWRLQAQEYSQEAASTSTAMSPVVLLPLLREHGTGEGI